MLSVGQAPAAIRAAVLAMKAADKDLQRTINQATRDTLNEPWRALIESYASSPAEARVLGAGARIKAGNPPVAQAATSRRRLSGGLIPTDAWHAFEFGADRGKAVTYQRRSPKGTTHSVTRHTRRQLPERRRSGRVIHRAYAEIAPRAVSLWVQTIVRMYHEAAERAES